MKAQRTRIVTLVGMALLITWPVTASAQQERVLPESGNANAERASARSDADHPAPAERNPRYKICRDDVLVLSFPLSPELNQKVSVQPDGFISLQSKGEF